MMERNKCKIVQDLLPSYVDKLTNEETSLYINEHLIDCENCKKMYNEMIKNTELSDCNKERKTINYMKKLNKKMNKLIFVILGIVLIFIIIISRRMFIKINLSLKAEKNLVETNYYTKITTYYDGNFAQGEGFYKDGKFFYNITLYYKEYKNIIYYKNENEIKMIEKTEDGTHIVENSTIAIKPTLYSLNGFWKELIDSVFNKIDVGYCNGKECYIINNGKEIKQYVSKDTGIILRVIQDTEEHYTISDYEFEFDQINEGEIEKKINNL